MARAGRSPAQNPRKAEEPVTTRGLSQPLYLSNPPRLVQRPGPETGKRENHRLLGKPGGAKASLLLRYEKRRHVHIRDKTGKINKLCKFWIEPGIELAKNVKFNSNEISELEKLISININLINKQLDKFYAGKKVKSITL